LNFLTDAEADVFPMIPGGKTIHDMVLDSSHKPVRSVAMVLMATATAMAMVPKLTACNMCRNGTTT
jgi:hypothetical protein